ncbi:FeoA family protein [Peptostreptococcus faecalis]|uniref:FeoA family protein n=1 Tax=Peptostreptococcus faecalis TaxID=2045015 RepID=UPI000C7A6983|nr:FeoA family protein [Peptostreptococcus faecalis]
MFTLRDAEVGNSYVVKKIHGTGPLKRRIMDMGITKNASLYIRKVAPLGDPIQITVRGYELTLRKEDSSCIEVELIEENE